MSTSTSTRLFGFGFAQHVGLPIVRGRCDGLSARRLVRHDLPTQSLDVRRGLVVFLHRSLPLVGTPFRQCVSFWWCALSLFSSHRVARPSVLQHPNPRRPVTRPDFVSTLFSVRHRSQPGSPKIWLPLPTELASASPPTMLPCPTAVPTTTSPGTTVDVLLAATTPRAVQAGAGAPAAPSRGTFCAGLEGGVGADYFAGRAVATTPETTCMCLA